MAPNAEDCETARLTTDCNGTPQGRRVLPHSPPPAQAWSENEEPTSTKSVEGYHLLPSKPASKTSRLQAGLTLGVHSKYPTKTLITKKPQKTKFQKRKEKLIEVLRPPYFILSMIMIMVCFYLFASDRIRSRMEFSPSHWKHEPWRLITYSIAHANTAHLALNALVALAVGWCLEREQGSWGVACVWFGGVCAGALGVNALQPHVFVVGASAAVFALLTAHIPNVCIRYGHVSLWWFRPLSVVVLSLSEGAWALMQQAAGADNDEHVAWAAHALGAAVGIPLGFLVFTGEHEKKLSIVAARAASAAILLMTGALFLLHAFWPEAFET